MPYETSTAGADQAVATVLAALNALPTGERLLALRSVAVLLGSRRASTVLAARAEGMSWQDIADRLGMSRQSVWDRYAAEDSDPPRPARGRRSRMRDGHAHVFQLRRLQGGHHPPVIGAAPWSEPSMTPLRHRGARVHPSSPRRVRCGVVSSMPHARTSPRGRCRRAVGRVARRHH